MVIQFLLSGQSLVAKGGKRPGAGRPREISRAVLMLEQVRTEMQRGFYDSAFQLSNNMPKLTEEAIKHALGGDKGLLKFLIEQYFKMVGALPSGEQDKYAEYNRRIAEAIERGVAGGVGASGKGNSLIVDVEAHAVDGTTVLRPDADKASDGGGEER